MTPGQHLRYGDCYRLAIGRRYSLDQAVHHYLTAAEGGDVDGWWLAGVEILFNAKEQEDLEAGLSYLLEAYDAGSSVAARHLAMLHFTGRLVEQDTETALRYLGEAARTADQSAWAMLYYVYSRGTYGVVRDEYTADFYLAMLKEANPSLASEDRLDAVTEAISNNFARIATQENMPR